MRTLKPKFTAHEGTQKQRKSRSLNSSSSSIPNGNNGIAANADEDDLAEYWNKLQKQQMHGGEPESEGNC